MIRKAGELSVRTRKSSGGRVSRRVTPTGLDPRGQPAITIFVHGIANNMQKATKDYSRMLNRLRIKLSPAYVGPLSRTYWFYWPGDIRLSKLSSLAYMWQITRAQRSAEVLTDYLTTLVGSNDHALNVTFVAHSLGCRLVLETVTKLEARVGELGGVNVSAYCLMAAAVPTYMCDPGANFGTPAAGRPEFVLYSAKDMVLRVFFPLGQALAGEGYFPEAVGRWGNPTNRWIRRTSWNTNLGHGKYYKSDGAIRHVAEMFNRGSQARALPLRSLMGSRPLAEYHLDERALRSRAVSI